MRKVLPLGMFFVLGGVVIGGALAQSAPAEKAVAMQKRRALQDASAEPRVMRLWEGAAPGALGDAEEDRPTLTLYAPSEEHAPGAAVIVIPGGSYEWLAMNHEGRQIANWLNAMGITAFVLKYRLGPKYHHPVELDDAQRAIRMVRAQAKEFAVLPDKIGVMGFSAGGHLASTAETHFDAGNAAAAEAIDRASSRPDFVVLCYPVISLVADYAHTHSRDNLLGKNPPEELEKELSSELQVTKETPPTFLWSSNTDDVVPAENSVAFYLALRKAGVPAELHIFSEAPHGVGLDLRDPSVGMWGELVVEWMRGRGILK